MASETNLDRHNATGLVEDIPIPNQDTLTVDPDEPSLLDSSGDGESESFLQCSHSDKEVGDGKVIDQSFCGR